MTQRYIHGLGWMDYPAPATDDQATQRQPGLACAWAFTLLMNAFCFSVWVANGNAGLATLHGTLILLNVATIYHYAQGS